MLGQYPQLYALNQFSGRLRPCTFHKARITSYNVCYTKLLRRSINTGPYAEAARTLLRGRIRTTKRFVDGSKVTDHHAIIPTEQPVNLSELNREESYNFV